MHIHVQVVKKKDKHTFIFQVCAFLRGLFHTGLIERGVIIAPPSVINTWANELEEVGIRDSKK